MTDDDLIQKYLRERGATLCPPQAAAVLGETTPGWRRNRERKAEQERGTDRRKQRLQAELAARETGASRVLTKSRARKRST